VKIIPDKTMIICPICKSPITISVVAEEKRGQILLSRKYQDLLAEKEALEEKLEKIEEEMRRVLDSLAMLERFMPKRKGKKRLNGNGRKQRLLE